MKSRDFRTIAREALKGNWVTSVMVTLVAIILGANVGSGNNAAGAPASSARESRAELEGLLQGNISPVLIGVIMAVISVLAIYVIIAIIFGGAAKLGFITYNIDLITNRNAPEFSTLFSRFSIFPKAFFLQLLTGIYIALWTLLFIIPGVIATYRYAMAPYILAENPDIGAGEAINRSKEMMKGHKWRLFCLEFSFIGWHILCAFTLGTGYLLLNPYIGVSHAAFYLELVGELPVEQQSAMEYSLQ